MKKPLQCTHSHRLFFDLPYGKTSAILCSMDRLFIKCALICAAVLLLSSCGGGLSGLDDDTLTEKSDACINNPPKSPGRVTACENVKTECNRRRTERGYAC